MILTTYKYSLIIILSGAILLILVQLNYLTAYNVDSHTTNGYFRRVNDTEERKLSPESYYLDRYVVSGSSDNVYYEHKDGWIISKEQPSTKQREKIPAEKSDRATKNYNATKDPSTTSQDVKSSLTSDQWHLKSKLYEPRRNHDCLILDIDEKVKNGNANSVIAGHSILVNILGRNARSVESLDLITGEHAYKISKGVDPAGFPINDLNHVYAVYVEKVDGSGAEAWLICGFHGDEVNNEFSSSYARIVDLETMEIRVGPKLQHAGGACSSLALYFDGPNKPPHICSFGGTYGKHNSGIYLDTVSCYNRVKKLWHNPIPKLPVGLDHSNAFHTPVGLCGEGEPERIYITNYRVINYGPATCEVWAYDLPPRKGTEWYLYAPCPEDDETGYNPFVGRDAAGIVISADKRQIITMGGVHYYRNTNDTRKDTVFDDAFMFDICTKQRSVVGDIGFARFALQSCTSSKLQVAVTCGGQPQNSEVFHAYHWHGKYSQKKAPQSLFNFPFCSVNTFPESVLDGIIHPFEVPVLDRSKDIKYYHSPEELEFLAATWTVKTETTPNAINETKSLMTTKGD